MVVPAEVLLMIVTLQSEEAMAVNVKREVDMIPVVVVLMAVVTEAMGHQIGMAHRQNVGMVHHLIVGMALPQTAPGQWGMEPLLTGPTHQGHTLEEVG